MPKKILIVEDNEINRILLRDVLAHYEYEVIEALNGKEGIEMAIKHRPDLVFMDIQMPVMDGITTIKKLRAIPEIQSIKVIALTAFAMKGDRERIMEAGFNDYMVKPIDIMRLPEMVRQILDEKLAEYKALKNPEKR